MISAVGALGSRRAVQQLKESTFWTEGKKKKSKIKEVAIHVRGYRRRKTATDGTGWECLDWVEKLKRTTLALEQD